jgi:GMP synthase-like glutamine amidotransferase
MDIKTDGGEDELVGLCDGLTILAILISGEVEAAADEVDVGRVDAEILG